MNSTFANIFLALQSYIQANVTAIKYIDQDLGQLKSGSRPPVAWPCVLIDFEDFSFENMSTNVQTAKGIVTLRLGFPPFSNSSQATPATYLQQAISYYDLEWALHKAIQGWAPGDDYGHLDRISTTTQKRTDSYRVRELRYSIAFEDYSTKPAQLYASPPISITGQILL
jgi:hypothetical protein